MRSLTSASLAVINGDAVPMVVLIEMQLSTTLRLCLADINLEGGGYTWLGVGTAAGFDGVTDATREAGRIAIRLSSVPVDALPLALDEPMQGKKVIISVAILDPSNNYQITNITQIFSGILMHPKVSEGGGLGSIEVQAESRSVTFSRIKALRLTDIDQRKLYPGDTSLQYITKQSNHQDVWPAASFYAK